MGRTLQIICGVVLAAIIGAGVGYVTSRKTASEEKVIAGGQYQPTEAEQRERGEKQEYAQGVVTGLHGGQGAPGDPVSAENAAEGQKQDKREESDLRAQISMAKWAEGVFWTGLIGVLVTFGGLVLIARTLHHTRRAADYAYGMLDQATQTTAAGTLAAMAGQSQVALARENSERQLRAYVGVDSASYSIALRENGSGAVAVSMTVKNFGQTPAYEFQTVANLSFRERQSAWSPLAQEGGKNTLFPGMTANVNVPLSFGPGTMGQITKGSHIFVAVITIDYRDLGNQRRQANIVYEIGPNVPNFKAEKHTGAPLFISGTST